MDDQDDETTIYDAVAGRVFHGGAVSDPQAADDDIKSNTLEPVPPDEVLARQSGAPPRNEENDIYSADRHLDPADPMQRLPDPDLLKALHAYASDFYARNGGEESFESLDETALLAMGILIEEAADEAVRQEAADEEWETDEEGESDESESDEESESEENGSSEEDSSMKEEVSSDDENRMQF